MSSPITLPLLQGAVALTLGLLGLLLPRDLDARRFVTAFRAIAGFALLQAATVWLPLLDPVHSSAGAPTAIGLATLCLALESASFAVLFAEGLRRMEAPRLTPVMAVPWMMAVSLLAVRAARPERGLEIEVAARWLLGLPGALLAARNLWIGAEWMAPSNRGCERGVRVAAAGLACAGLLVGAELPATDFAPASIINEVTAAQLLGAHLPLFETLALVVIAVGLMSAAAALRQESAALLAEAHDRLEARVAERTASLRQANADLGRQMAARERMEAAWRTIEADLAITLHSIGEAVISTNAAGQVSRMNPAAERLTGLSIDGSTAGPPGGALGRLLVDLLHFVDDAGQPLDDRLRAGLTGDGEAPGEGAALPSEATLVCADGARRALALSCAPIIHHRHRGPNGTDERRRLGSVLVLRDIGERRKLEERLRLGDRLASLGTMAAGVAHEINNPLTYVTLNVDIVAKELSTLCAELGEGSHVPAADAGTDTETIRARLADLTPALTEAQEGAARVRRIVRDLKLFSRNDDALGPIDVRRVAEAACNMAWNEVRHRAKLVKHLGEVVPVDANEARLGQVLVSLLINAAQAIPEGRAERNQITIVTGASGARGEGGVFIEVRDTGGGIAPEHLPRLFDPFFTTRAVGAGTGLGLAVCHGIVRALGGQILVESTVGQGSTFRIELPPSKSAHATPDVTAAAAAPNTARRARLLLVDDEVMILRTMRRSIGKDADLVALTRAEEALELIRGGERFDLILCDLMMPTMTGMELYDELARLAPDQAARIVFVTGGAFTPAAQEFLARSEIQQLGKPVDLAELKKLIERRTAHPAAAAVAA